jgi:hypothetical protein
MRPRLLHPLSEHRDTRRRRAIGGSGRPRRAHRGRRPSAPDPAVLRAREAGGPIDRACYSCECGYLFVAAVSTTVRCPHCGAGQAW